MNLFLPTFRKYTERGYIQSEFGSRKRSLYESTIMSHYIYYLKTLETIEEPQ